MAEKLRNGIDEIIGRREALACVYGESSTFHLYFGARSIDGLDADTIRGVPVETLTKFRQALNVRGADLMSRASGVLSGVHTEEDIDRGLEAFDGAIQAMLEEGLLRHS